MNWEERNAKAEAHLLDLAGPLDLDDSANVDTILAVLRFIASRRPDLFGSVYRERAAAAAKAHADAYAAIRRSVDRPDAL